MFALYTPLETKPRCCRTYRWHSWQKTCSWASPGRGRRSWPIPWYQWWRCCHTWDRDESPVASDCVGTTNPWGSADTSSWAPSGLSSWTALCTYINNTAAKKIQHAHYYNIHFPRKPDVCWFPTAYCDTAGSTLARLLSGALTGNDFGQVLHTPVAVPLFCGWKGRTLT